MLTNNYLHINMLILYSSIVTNVTINYFRGVEVAVVIVVVLVAIIMVRIMISDILTIQIAIVGVVAVAVEVVGKGRIIRIR